MSNHSNSTEEVSTQPSISLLLLESLTDKVTELHTSQPSQDFGALLEVLTQLKDHFRSFPSHPESKVSLHFFEIMRKYLGEGLTMVDEWRDIKRSADLRILLSKLRVFVRVFSSAVSAEDTDLFCLEECDGRWERLRERTEVITVRNEERLRRDMQSLLSRMAVNEATLMDAFEYSDGIMRKIQAGMRCFYYHLFTDSAKERVRLGHASPSAEVTIAYWNLLDSKFFAPICSSLLVPIHLNTVIYLPRIAPHVLLSPSPPDLLSQQSKHYIEQLYTDPASSHASYSQYLDPAGLRIPVRVLCPYDLPLTEISRGENRSWWSLCWRGNRPGKDPKRLILHIHGGAFIAMNSKSHQNYTRKWAIETDTPVLSVDYRLAPQHRFPDALDDCWQAYMWLLQYAKKYLGITPGKIIIAGDSAGGDLALGVVLRSIQTFQRIPDGLLLSYPVVSLDTESFTPSLSYSLEDPVIHYSLPQFINSVYLHSSETPSSDPLISPLLAETGDLEQFPPTRLIVCALDPLLDNALRFADRLLGVCVNVKVARFEGLMHGQLNWDAPWLGVQEAREVVSKGTEFLKELAEI